MHSRKSIQEIIEKLRNAWTKGTQQDFEAEAEKQGLSRDGGKKMFTLLEGKELRKDPEGFW